MGAAGASVALLVGLVGCGADSGSRSDAEAALEVREQAVDRDRRLALSETWRVGHAGDPQETQLYQVRAADLGSDGSVFILDSGNDRVVVVDTAGRLARQFGRAGAGPGEFARAGGLVVRRDTVLIQDSNSRVHFFEAGGDLASTQLLAFPDGDVNHLSMVASAERAWFVSAVGYFQNGTVDEPPLLREHVFLVDPATGDLEAAGLRWSKESIGESHNNFFWLQPILIHRPAYGLDGLGRFLVADTATYRVDVYGLEGALRFRLENQVERIPIDDAVLELWRASRNCPGGSEMAVECSREMDQKTFSLPRTEHRPVVLRLRAYQSGHFSVLRGDLDPNPFDGLFESEYDHFGPDGTFLGSTSGTVPLSFDGQLMISLERDSLGVESVVRYQVGDASTGHSP